MADPDTSAALNTVRLGDGPRGVRAAAALLTRGGLVAFPTETVYGLGADAMNERAVAGIYAAKGRPAHNPLIIHVLGIEEAASLADIDPAARRAAAAFWPGPLSLVLPVRADSRIAAPCLAGGRSVALRAPASRTARDLLAAFGGPIAAPSANRSGAVSPTTADHVLDGLSGRIDAVIDGGPCTIGLESTILGFGPDGPRLLRPGGVTIEALEAALGRVACDAVTDDATPSAPGQLSSHYAPGARLRLDAESPRLGEAWLGFGPGPSSALSRNLSESGNLEEAAATLFALLRDLDEGLSRRGTIAVAPIPQHGLGRAINDRLARAASPR